MKLTSKSVLTGMPWKTIILGIVMQAILLMFLFGFRCFYYVRHLTYTWTENYFDFMLYLGFLLIVTSIMAKMKKKINPNTFAILFTFYAISYPLTHLITRGPSLAAIIPYSAPWATDLIPKWLQLSSEEAAKAYTGQGIINWAEWTVPIMFWSFHLIVVLLMCNFLMAIWRRQWIEVENLPYPHSVPVAEVINIGKSENILKEKMLWYGFIIAVVLYMWDPIRMLTRGATPRLPLYTIHYAEWVGAPCISLLAQTKANILLAFSPDHLMAAFLLPLDILLSAWVSIIVFHWLKPAIGITAGIYPDLSGQGWWTFYLNDGWFFWPPNMTLGWGMWIGIALWCFWSGRDHLKNIINVIRGKADAVDDSVISYKWSVPLFIIFALIWVATMLAAGSTPILTIAFSIFYMLIFLAIGRIKAEFWTGGRPVRLGGSVGWMSMSYWYLPTGTYNQGDGQSFSMFFNNLYGNTIDVHSGFPPRANDAFKVGDLVGDKNLGRQIFVTSIIATVFGVIFATYFRILWAYNNWGYTYGWGGNEGGGLNKPLYEGVYSEGGAYAGGVEIYALGAIISIILFLLKTRFAWWPINPIGFAAPLNFWVMPWLFLPFFFAWLWKYVTLKIGGAPLHRRMMRLVIGFIAGYAIINVIEWFIVVFVIGPGARPPPV